MKKHFSRTVSVLFLIIFLPILFCVFVFGNNMDYFSELKQHTLFHNIFMLPIGLVLAAIVFWLKKYVNRLTIIGKRLNSIVFVTVTVLIFAVFFVASVKIAKCIAFYTGWDMSMISGSVYAMSEGTTIANDFYFKYYQHNVPLFYVLYKLYAFAKSMPNFPYNAEFFWIEVACLSLSLSGLFTTLTVRRITKKAAPTIFAMLLFLASIGITPWKVIPYSDILTIMFGALIIYLFALFNDIKSNLRYILWVLMCFIAIFASLIKATVCIPLIAVVMVHIVTVLAGKGVKDKLIKLCAALVPLALCLVLAGLYRNHIYKEVEFTPDVHFAVTWHHYLRMGFNEQTTGAFNSDYYGLINAYLDRDPAERHAEEYRLIKEAYRERGVLGSLYFYLRKSVMNYNDGSFGWYLEGSFQVGEYQNISNSRFKPLLREIFWLDGKYYHAFITYAQLMWLFTILLLPVSALHLFKDADDSPESASRTSVILAILGITLFVMIFEGRAKYLLNNAPIYITAAALSLNFFLASKKDVVK